MLPPPGPQRIYRWLVDIDAWPVRIGDAEWQLLLRCLSEEEATKVMRFLQDADKKRAMVSRLLQRRACFQAFGVGHSDVRIERTKGGKPFMANKPTPAPPDAPNWNFNVSHEGRYVAIVSETFALCGVDIAAPGAVRDGKRRPMSEQLRLMKDQLTDTELRTILAAGPDEEAMEGLFRRFWSLKEAYTKARGDGLGFEFNRCEFTLGEWHAGAAEGHCVQLASVRADGQPRPNWGFYIHQRDNGHWISVARGPVGDAVDAHGKFRSTFESGRARSEAAGVSGELQEALARDEAPFVVKRVIDLLSEDVREEYARLAGVARTG